KEHYVLLDPLVIRASNYGAPTKRTRVFFVGYDPKQFTRDLTRESFLPPDTIEPMYVRQALQGLPFEISPNWLSEESGWQPIIKSDGTHFFRRVSGCIPEGVGDIKSVERYCAKNEISGCMGTRHAAEIEER